MSCNIILFSLFKKACRKENKGVSHSRNNVSPREVVHSTHTLLGLHGAPATLPSSVSVGLDFALSPSGQSFLSLLDQQRCAVEGARLLSQAALAANPL